MMTAKPDHYDIHYRVQNVWLSDLDYHVPKKWERDLQILANVEQETIIEGKTLLVKLTFSLVDEDDEPDFRFEATFVATIDVLSEDPTPPVNQFVKINAPALVFPFVREMLANVTSRSLVGTLMMPMINFVELANAEHPTQILKLARPSISETESLELQDAD